MSNYTRDDILQLIEDEDIEFIRLQFTDIFGNLKNVAVTSSQIERVLDNKCMFDGSSIDGFSSVEESDMYLHPDLDTFTIFPWRPQQGKVARFICDVYNDDGTPAFGDTRTILKNVLKEIHEMGYVAEIGPECEFFLFNTDDNGRPTVETFEKAGYFEMGVNDLGENARRDMVLTLEDMGFEIESSHHESANGQHEIDFKYSHALRAADDIQTFKLAVKTIAKRHGLHATFMPKPNTDTNGSGMHLNFSLAKDGKNIFNDSNDEYGLSKEAYWFIGGLMKHVYSMSAITNPIVNSYKRLVSGFEAPVHIAWSLKNRSPLIRIPSSKDGNTRIELRSPDSASNPYLTLAVCLAAGMDGIKNKIDPPQCVRINTYNLTDDECNELGIKKLPQTLLEAIVALENDDFTKKIIGEHVFDLYIDAKKKECEQYRRQVTDWEIENYLGKY